MAERMREYQNYIFDLYGTLVDIRTNEAKLSLWKNLANVYSLMGASYEPAELKESYRQLVKEEIADTLPIRRQTFSDPGIVIEEVEILLEHVFDQLLARKGVAADEEMIRQTGLLFRGLSWSYIRLYDGVRVLLSALKKAGKNRYLLSNAQRIFTEPEMKMLGIYNQFDGILYSSDVGVKKPSCHFYDALFERYGLKKEESVMIGNEYVADICGAANYGIDSMYIFTAQSGKKPAQLPERCRRLGQIREVFS
jgi:putative hydrolase of the HAD superfamily